MLGIILRIKPDGRLRIVAEYLDDVGVLEGGDVLFQTTRVARQRAGQLQRDDPCTPPSRASKILKSSMDCSSPAGSACISDLCDLLTVAFHQTPKLQRGHADTAETQDKSQSSRRSSVLKR